MKTVKKVRADLNAQFNVLEAQRKAVKSAVMDPYNAFEAVYQECVSNKYKAADSGLKSKIIDVEDGLKQAKTGELAAYFEELRQAAHIEFISLDDAGINVTLSASLKSLKEQAKSYVDRVVYDLECIKTSDFQGEVLVEYMLCRDIAQATYAVDKRHKDIERQREAEARRSEASSLEQCASAKSEAFAPPTASRTPTDPDDDVLTLTFTVTSTRRKLKSLKNFLIVGEYQLN